MPGFVKPTRKVVNIEDAFGALISQKQIVGEIPYSTWTKSKTVAIRAISEMSMMP